MFPVARGRRSMSRLVFQIDDLKTQAAQAKNIKLMPCPSISLIFFLHSHSTILHFQLKHKAHSKQIHVKKTEHKALYEQLNRTWPEKFRVDEYEKWHLNFMVDD